MSFRKDLIKWEKFCAKRDRKHAKQEFKREEIVRERDAAFMTERNEKIMAAAPVLLSQLLSTFFKPSAVSYPSPAPTESPGILAPRLTLTYTEGEKLYSALSGLRSEAYGIIFDILLSNGVVINPPSQEPQPEPEKKVNAVPAS